MSRGVLVFARNNSKVDYVKQAYFLAKRVRKYLDLPTTIVTDSVGYLEREYKDHAEVFDTVINLNKIKRTEALTTKTFYDGSSRKYSLEFKNDARTLAYDLSPYDETLVLDSDIIIQNDNFLNCFGRNLDFQIYSNSVDIAGYRDYSEFTYFKDLGIKFYWATCVYFTKTKQNSIFFNLLKHIQENWKYYNHTYSVDRSTFRNDYAFSIAIHIMNGHNKGNFAQELPGTLFYITDRDVLQTINNDSCLVLVEKKDCLGEYTPVKVKGLNLHAMNKFSLNRCIGDQL